MKKLIAAALVGTMVLTMAGCGSKTAETTGSEASSDAAGGTLVMATNAEFPPYEYYEGENVVGIDADIAAAVADKLGMELKIEDMAFDSIIPAVTAILQVRMTWKAKRSVYSLVPPVIFMQVISKMQP